MATTSGDLPRDERAVRKPNGAPARVRASWQALGQFLNDRYLSLDTRWLGVFRVALGCLLIVEVLRRWYYAPAFYTNDGLLPNHYSLFAPMGHSVFSIYHAFSTYAEISVAFFVTLLVFVTFTLGYRTRVFHVLSAVAITGLNARNLFIENGGTVVVNILTVYTLFLPLGARFSIDSVRNSLRRKVDRSLLDLNGPDPTLAPTRTSSLVVALLLLQWSAIYFFNTVHKDGHGWKDGTAFHWFLHQDRIVTVAGIWLREHLPLSAIHVMTYGALVVEGSLAFLILFPFFQKWTRRTIFVLVWFLHGTIALTARIGPFSYAMMLFPILLLGAEDFELVTRPFRAAARVRRVIVNAASPLAFAVARFVARLDPFHRIEWVDARATERLPQDAPRAPFWVMAPNAEPRTNLAALRELCRALPFGAWLRALVSLPGLAGLLERGVRKFWGADRRIAQSLGLSRTGRDPAHARPVKVQEPTAWEAFMERTGASVRELAVVLLGTAVITTILVQNSFVSRHVRLQRAAWMVEVIEYPRLLQGWSMFAPEPPYEDGRVVVDGRTADGRKFDPFSGGVPDFDPHAPRGWDHSQFWCDYHNRIRFGDNADHRRHLRDYLLRQHELTHQPENRLVAFDVWWVQDRSPSPGETRGRPLPPEKLLSHGRVTDSGAKSAPVAPPDPAQPNAKRRNVPLIGP
jgi:hypothetical protein